MHIKRALYVWLIHENMYETQIASLLLFTQMIDQSEYYFFLHPSNLIDPEYFNHLLF